MLERYSQDTQVRPYLTTVCQFIFCEVPAFQAPFKIDIIETDAVFPDAYPGGIKVRVTLRNTAEFSQPYPKLRITLRDNKDRVVGRRVYMPVDYLPFSKTVLLANDSQKTIDFNLVQPHEKAVDISVDIFRS